MSRARRLFVAALAWLPMSIVHAKLATPSLLSRPPRRFHAVTGLRPERADDYFKLHAAVWPEVLKMIERANIRNFSIAVKEIEGKLYLFSYYEYVGDDYERDMKKVAADPGTQRWWKETEPCQVPLPDAAAKRIIWSDAREVFYTP